MDDVLKGIVSRMKASPIIVIGLAMIVCCCGVSIGSSLFFNFIGGDATISDVQVANHNLLNAAKNEKWDALETMLTGPALTELTAAGISQFFADERIEPLVSTYNHVKVCAWTTSLTNGNRSIRAESLFYYQGGNALLETQMIKNNQGNWAISALAIYPQEVEMEPFGLCAE